MKLIRECPRCGAKGKNIYSRVECMGHKRYTYDVDCLVCSYGFISNIYSSGVQAKGKGIEEWNDNYYHGQ